MDKDTQCKSHLTPAAQHHKLEWHPDNTCKWHSDDDGYWNTGCHEKFVFIDGGPKENGFKFCPYCGNKLRAGKLRTE